MRFKISFWCEKKQCWRDWRTFQLMAPTGWTQDERKKALKLKQIAEKTHAARGSAFVRHIETQATAAKLCRLCGRRPNQIFRFLEDRGSGGRAWHKLTERCQEELQIMRW